MQNLIDVSPEEAAAELLRRKRGREHLIDFTEYTLHKYYADPFHHLVAEKLEAVERGEIKRLMLFAPPRHGKSELSTRRFPAWYMARNPEKNIISASYNGDFATTFGRDVRNIVQGKEFKTLFPDAKIRTDNRAADEWELEKGGKYFAVGVGTGTTGKGANLFLIDDPIKDRKDANSASFRQDQWDWYRDVVYTRLEEDAAIVLTLTRWHYDDIAGRLIDLAQSGKGMPWDILYLPALPYTKKRKNEDGTDGELILNEDGTVPGDALGRKPNEPLAPNRFSLTSLRDRMDVLGERSFAALYQQQPMADDGGMFSASWFEAPGEMPARRVRVRAWDLAASADGDYTVGVLMSKDMNGVFYIENVIRFRGSSLEVEKKIFDTARSDGHSVQIVIPQDPGQAGKSQAQNFIRRLAGYRIKAIRPTGSKETRAAAFAAQCEGRNVKMVKAHWNECFTDELEMFPLGTNDDQVDAASDAFNELLGPRKAAILDW